MKQLEKCMRMYIWWHMRNPDVILKACFLASWWLLGLCPSGNG